MNIDDIANVIKSEHSDSNSSSEYYPEVLQVEEDCIKETGTKIVLRKLKKLTTSLTPEYIKKTCCKAIWYYRKRVFIFCLCKWRRGVY